MNTNELTPTRRWINESISAGKFCELIGVPRHIGEEQILHDIWLLKEHIKKIRKQGQFKDEAIRRKSKTITLMNSAHKALMIERDDLKEKIETSLKGLFDSANTMAEENHQLRAENTMLKVQNDSLDRELTRRDNENAKLRASYQDALSEIATLKYLDDEAKVGATEVSRQLDQLRSENAELLEDRKRLERLMTLERGDLMWFHQEQDKRRALDVLMEEE